MKVIVVRQLPNRGKFETGNVLSPNGLCGSLKATDYKTRRLLRSPMKQWIIENFYQSREMRIYDKISPTIRSGRQGLLVMVEVEDEQDSRSVGSKQFPTSCRGWDGYPPKNTQTDSACNNQTLRK